MKRKTSIKIITIVCSALISIALLIARNSPAKGYESSIYISTPVFVWESLLISYVCGIIILINHLYTNKSDKDNMWVFGLFLLFLSYTILLSLWIIRGYTLWCPGDPLSHLGIIQNIVSRGYIESGNFYPITHIYVSESSLICNIAPILLHKYIPLIFGLFYVIFMHLFAKSVFSTKNQVILATVCSVTLLPSWYLNLTPNHLSNLVFPVIFFLLLKSFTSSKIQWKILFIIIVFLFPPFHPVPSIVLLLILLTITLPNKILYLSTISNKNFLRAKQISKFNIMLSLILAIWSIVWISSFGVWKTVIYNINALIAEGGPNYLSTITQDIKYAEGYGYNVTEYFFKIYGGLIIYIILTIVAFLIIWKKASERGHKKIFSLYGPLVAITFFCFILFIFNLPFSPLRLIAYMLIICTLFASFTLNDILKKAQESHANILKLAIILTILLLIGVSINGALKLYPSPYTFSANFQITQSEIEGTDWFFHNKNTTISISSWYFAYPRYADFLMNLEEKKQRKDLTPYMGSAFPFHFGYENYSMLGQSYNKDAYLVLTERVKRAYIDIYPDMAKIRLLPSDFEKLDNDSSIEKLYSNEEFDVWYIHAFGIGM